MIINVIFFIRVFKCIGRLRFRCFYGRFGSWYKWSWVEDNLGIERVFLGLVLFGIFGKIKF